jgi:hypothetical protein
MPKKGGFINLETLVSSGLGAYAAKQSSSMTGLLGTLAKYALVIIGITIALIVVLRILGMATEGFMVPVKPSKEGDEKLVTPAGNVIIY